KLEKKMRIDEDGK
ncbi:hypothetical protein c7_L1343, partial [Megavirus courdo7]